MNFKSAMEVVGYTIDGFGVAVIVVGVLAATVWFLFRLRSFGLTGAYTSYRQTIGRAILLGLELLVAGDIIRTVAVAPTLDNVMVLGVIVLIRTFLSVSIQFELEGHLPWQRRDRKALPNGNAQQKEQHEN